MKEIISAYLSGSWVEQLDHVLVSLILSFLQNQQEEAIISY